MRVSRFIFLHLKFIKWNGISRTKLKTIFRTLIVAETVILQKLRGHDSEIVSLQWSMIKSTPPLPKETEVVVQCAAEATEKTDEKSPMKSGNAKDTKQSSKSKLEKTDKKPTRREPPKPIVDAGDMFDIYSYDYLEDEFGTISTTRPATHEEPPVEDHTLDTHNENFNFAEECQTLREQIRAGNKSDSDDSYGYSTTKAESAVNMSDIRNMMKARSPVQDGSIELSDVLDLPAEAEADVLSNRSTIGSSHNTTEIAELEDVIKDLKINEGTATKSDGIVYLASGAQESCIVIWNAQTGAICDRIQLKSQARSKIPSEYKHL